MPADDPGPWGALPRTEADRWGEDIFDPETRRRWCSAILMGGLPYLWGYVARVPRALMLDALELRDGDRVLLVGEAIDDVGFNADITSAIGSAGDLVAIDLRSEVIDRIAAGRETKWEWEEIQVYSDEHFDCVLVGQAVAHAGDWQREGRELLRVMKSGRRIVLGEIAFSRHFNTRMQADVHLEYWVRKLLDGMGIEEGSKPYSDMADVASVFSGLVDEPETFEWRGVELLWGRKP